MFDALRSRFKTQLYENFSFLFLFFSTTYQSSLSFSPSLFLSFFFFVKRLKRSELFGSWLSSYRKISSRLLLLLLLLLFLLLRPSTSLPTSLSPSLPPSSFFPSHLAVPTFSQQHPVFFSPFRGTRRRWRILAPSRNLQIYLGRFVGFGPTVYIYIYKCVCVCVRVHHTLLFLFRSFLSIFFLFSYVLDTPECRRKKKEAG